MQKPGNRRKHLIVQRRGTDQNTPGSPELLYCDASGCCPEFYYAAVNSLIPDALNQRSCHDPGASPHGIINYGHPHVCRAVRHIKVHFENPGGIFSPYDSVIRGYNFYLYTELPYLAYPGFYNITERHQYIRVIIDYRFIQFML